MLSRVATCQPLGRATGKWGDVAFVISCQKYARPSPSTAECQYAGSGCPLYLLGERTMPFSFSVPEDIGGEEARAAASEAPLGPVRGAERPHTPSQKMRMQTVR